MTVARQVSEMSSGYEEQRPEAPAPKRTGPAVGALLWTASHLRGSLRGQEGTSAGET